jgi:hypothetical protein
MLRELIVIKIKLLTLSDNTLLIIFISNPNLFHEMAPIVKLLHGLSHEIEMKQICYCWEVYCTKVIQK